MIQLFIDNQLAVVKSGTNFKFNVDNQVFSQQGSYSMEITLPLTGCAANMSIFGTINRSEVRLNEPSGTFKLITELLTYEGKYKIVEVDEDEVKVQLMADKTLMNALSKDIDGKDVFIDELDLGFFWDEWNWEEKYESGDYDNYPAYPPESIKDLALFIDATYQKYIHAPRAVSSCVCFPIKSTRSDDDHYVSNSHTFLRNGKYGIVFGYHMNPKFERINLAVQPNLFYVVKKIFKSLGFDFYGGSSLFLNSYIANYKSKLYIKDILPHWTAQEFLKEISNFFNLSFVYEGNVVKAIERKSLFEGDAQYIEDVVDDFTLQFEDESQEDYTATGNVDYEWPVEDNLLRLPDEVFERAIIEECTNYHEVQVKASSISDTEKQKSKCLYIDKQTGRKYAYLFDIEKSQFLLSEVDYYAPLIRDDKTRDINTSLRIVPVRIKKSWVGSNVTDVPTMFVDDYLEEGNSFSINDCINPDAQTSPDKIDNSKRDVVELFFWNGGCYDSKNLPISIGVMLEKNSKSGLLEKIKFSSNAGAVSDIGPFELNARFGGKKGFNIDTKNMYCFKFLHRGSLDINQPFIIRGKKYICKQLQYDCSDEGVQPLIQGYFYAMD